MPSTSAKQHRFMEAIAHNSAFAKKAGVPQSVGKDFSAADKGKKFAGGGAATQKINRQDTQHGAMDMPFKSLKKFTGMKSGGKVRRFDEGGLSDAQQAWLGAKKDGSGNWSGGADSKDEIINYRMKQAVPTPRVSSSGREPDTEPTDGRKASAPAASAPAAPTSVAAAPTSVKADPSGEDFSPIKYKVSDETGKVYDPDEIIKAAPSTKTISKATSKATPADAPKPKYTSAQDVPKYVEKAYPKKPAAKPKVDAEDDDFAKKIKKNKADDEASASNVVDRSVALASAIPFAGPAARFGSKAFKAFKAFRNSRGAMATKNAASKVKPNAGKPEDFNKLSQAERDRIAGRNRNVRDESGDRTGLREDESMKKGGKVGMKKPNPFMEMIAKKKEKAEGESPSFQKKEGKKGEKAEMRFAKGGMTGYSKGSNMNAKGSMSGSSRSGENTKIQKKGLTEGKVIKMASGGSVSSRADGIASRGKTNCKIC